MTSLLSRMLRLFPESVPLEDLFTEAVARLFERNPELCVAWLEGADLLASSPAGRDDDRYVRISSQRPFAPLEHHDTASRPDLLIEVQRPPRENAGEADRVVDVVFVESKIGSGEGHEQLRRYAEHLDAMAGSGGRTLLYVTRAYDPKDEKDILAGLGENVRFEQLRWHDFYRFLQKWADKDALVEEVMAFMEEQGMSRSYRFSAGDLMAIAGVSRAFEIFDETLGGEVKAELESFAGHKTRSQTHGLNHIRWHNRYIAIAPLHEWDLFCFVGYTMRTAPDGYPAARVHLESRPGANGRAASIAAMKKIALIDGWDGYGLDDPKAWAGVRRKVSLASVLQEDDHVAVVKRFFVQAIRQLREELTNSKKEHPNLPWKGGKVEGQDPA